MDSTFDILEHALPMALLGEFCELHGPVARRVWLGSMAGASSPSQSPARRVPTPAPGEPCPGSLHSSSQTTREWARGMSLALRSWRPTPQSSSRHHASHSTPVPAEDDDLLMHMFTLMVDGVIANMFQGEFVVDNAAHTRAVAKKQTQASANNTASADDGFSRSHQLVSDSFGTAGAAGSPAGQISALSLSTNSFATAAADGTGARHIPSDHWGGRAAAPASVDHRSGISAATPSVHSPPSVRGTPLDTAASAETASTTTGGEKNEASAPATLAEFVRATKAQHQTFVASHALDSTNCARPTSNPAFAPPHSGAPQKEAVDGAVGVPAAATPPTSKLRDSHNTPSPIVTGGVGNGGGGDENVGQESELSPLRTEIHRALQSQVTEATAEQSARFSACVESMADDIAAIYESCAVQSVVLTNSGIDWGYLAFCKSFEDQDTRVKLEKLWEKDQDGARIISIGMDRVFEPRLSGDGRNLAFPAERRRVMQALDAEQSSRQASVLQNHSLTSHPGTPGEVGGGGLGVDGQSPGRERGKSTATTPRSNPESRVQSGRFRPDDADGRVKSANAAASMPAPPRRAQPSRGGTGRGHLFGRLVKPVQVATLLVSVPDAEARGGARSLSVSFVLPHAALVRKTASTRADVFHPPFRTTAFRVAPSTPQRAGGHAGKSQTSSKEESSFFGIDFARPSAAPEGATPKQHRSRRGSVIASPSSGSAALDIADIPSAEVEEFFAARGNLYRSAFKTFSAIPAVIRRGAVERYLAETGSLQKSLRAIKAICGPKHERPLWDAAAAKRCDAEVRRLLIVLSSTAAARVSPALAASIENSEVARLLRNVRALLSLGEWYTGLQCRTRQIVVEKRHQLRLRLRHHRCDFAELAATQFDHDVPTTNMVEPVLTRLIAVRCDAETIPQDPNADPASTSTTFHNSSSLNDEAQHVQMANMLGSPSRIPPNPTTELGVMSAMGVNTFALRGLKAATGRNSADPRSAAVESDSDKSTVYSDDDDDELDLADHDEFDDCDKTARAFIPGTGERAQVDEDSMSTMSEPATSNTSKLHLATPPHEALRSHGSRPRDSMDALQSSVGNDPSSRGGLAGRAVRSRRNRNDSPFLHELEAVLQQVNHDGQLEAALEKAVARAAKIELDRLDRSPESDKRSRSRERDSSSDPHRALPGLSTYMAESSTAADRHLHSSNGLVLEALSHHTSCLKKFLVLSHAIVAPTCLKPQLERLLSSGTRFLRPLQDLLDDDTWCATFTEQLPPHLVRAHPAHIPTSIPHGTALPRSQTKLGPLLDNELPQHIDEFQRKPAVQRVGSLAAALGSEQAAQRQTTLALQDQRGSASPALSSTAPPARPGRSVGAGAAVPSPKARSPTTPGVVPPAAGSPSRTFAPPVPLAPTSCDVTPPRHNTSTLPSTPHQDGDRGCADRVPGSAASASLSLASDPTTPDGPSPMRGAPRSPSEIGDQANAGHASPVNRVLEASESADATPAPPGMQQSLNVTPPAKLHPIGIDAVSKANGSSSSPAATQTTTSGSSRPPLSPGAAQHHARGLVFSPNKPAPPAASVAATNEDESESPTRAQRHEDPARSLESSLPTQADLVDLDDHSEVSGGATKPADSKMQRASGPRRTHQGNDDDEEEGHRVGAHTHRKLTHSGGDASPISVPSNVLSPKDGLRPTANPALVTPGASDLSVDGEASSAPASLVDSLPTPLPSASGVGGAPLGFGAGQPPTATVVGLCDRGKHRSEQLHPAVVAFLRRHADQLFDPNIKIALTVDVFGDYFVAALSDPSRHSAHRDAMLASAAPTPSHGNSGGGTTAGTMGAPSGSFGHFPASPQPTPSAAPANPHAHPPMSPLTVSRTPATTSGGPGVGSQGGLPLPPRSGRGGATPMHQSRGGGSNNNSFASSKAVTSGELKESRVVVESREVLTIFRDLYFVLSVFEKYHTDRQRAERAAANDAANPTVHGQTHPCHAPSASLENASDSKTGSVQNLFDSFRLSAARDDGDAATANAFGPTTAKSTRGSGRYHYDSVAGTPLIRHFGCDDFFDAFFAMCDAPSPFTSNAPANTAGPAALSSSFRSTGALGNLGGGGQTSAPLTPRPGGAIGSGRFDSAGHSGSLKMEPQQKACEITKATTFLWDSSLPLPGQQPAWDASFNAMSVGQGGATGTRQRPPMAPSSLSVESDPLGLSSPLLGPAPDVVLSSKSIVSKIPLTGPGVLNVRLISSRTNERSRRHVFDLTADAGQPRGTHIAKEAPPVVEMDAPVTWLRFTRGLASDSGSLSARSKKQQQDGIGHKVPLSFLPKETAEHIRDYLTFQAGSSASAAKKRDAKTSSKSPSPSPREALTRDSFLGRFAVARQLVEASERQLLLNVTLVQMRTQQYRKAAIEAEARAEAERQANVSVERARRGEALRSSDTQSSPGGLFRRVVGSVKSVTKLFSRSGPADGSQSASNQGGGSGDGSTSSRRRLDQVDETISHPHSGPRHIVVTGDLPEELVASAVRSPSPQPPLRASREDVLASAQSGKKHHGRDDAATISPASSKRTPPPPAGHDTLRAEKNASPSIAVGNASAVGDGGSSVEAAKSCHSPPALLSSLGGGRLSTPPPIHRGVSTLSSAPLTALSAPSSHPSHVALSPLTTASATPAAGSLARPSSLSAHGDSQRSPLCLPEAHGAASPLAPPKSPGPGGLGEHRGNAPKQNPTAVASVDTHTADASNTQIVHSHHSDNDRESSPLNVSSGLLSGSASGPSPRRSGVTIVDDDDDTCDGDANAGRGVPSAFETNTATKKATAERRRELAKAFEGSSSATFTSSMASPLNPPVTAACTNTAHQHVREHHPPIATAGVATREGQAPSDGSAPISALTAAVSESTAATNSPGVQNASLTAAHSGSGHARQHSTGGFATLWRESSGEVSAMSRLTGGGLARPLSQMSRDLSSASQDRMTGTPAAVTSTDLLDGRGRQDTAPSESTVEPRSSNGPNESASCASPVSLNPTRCSGGNDKHSRLLSDSADGVSRASTEEVVDDPLRSPQGPVPVPHPMARQDSATDSVGRAHHHPARQTLPPAAVAAPQLSGRSTTPVHASLTPASASVSVQMQDRSLFLQREQKILEQEQERQRVAAEAAAAEGRQVMRDYTAAVRSFSGGRIHGGVPESVEGITSGGVGRVLWASPGDSANANA